MLHDSPSDAAPVAARAPGFDYDALLAGPRAWLLGATDQVRRFAYRTAVNLIRSGMVIREVRAGLRERTFRKWLATELPWSKSRSCVVTAADAREILDAHRPVADLTRDEL